MLSTYPLTAEQIEIGNAAREFARREILPLVTLYEDDPLFDSDLPHKIAQSGLVNGRIDADFGGLGLSLLETTIIAREIAQICCGIGSVIEASELAITFILAGGSKEQKEMYLGNLIKNSGLAGIDLSCLTDHCNSENLNIKRQGDTTIINGFCPLVVNASIAEWFVVGRGKEYYVIPKDTLGLSLSPPIVLLGRKAADFRRVEFSNVNLQSIARINISKTTAEAVSTHNSAIIAAGCVGLAQSALNYAVDYSKQRKAFGTLIINHQAVAFMLADIAADIEAASLLSYQSASACIASSCPSKSALAFALDCAGKVTIDAVQIFGGYGYTKEYLVEKLMRDAKTYQSLFGPSTTIKEKIGADFLSLS